MNKQSFVLLFGAILFCISANAQRVSYTINESWKFSKGELDASQVDFNDSSWEMVSIPHTWNDLDTTDDTSGYYMGESWYRRNIVVDRDLKNCDTYLQFEGANQEVELFVNGQSAGTHRGGYTRFTFDITPYIQSGENNIAIKVSNKYNPSIAPLSADFTFFGGIYRDLYITHTPKLHISADFYSSSGVFITTPSVSKTEAEVVIKTKISNNIGKAQKAYIESRILDPLGHEVTKEIKKVKVAEGDSEITLLSKIQNPILWDTENPNMYTVITRILNDKEEQVDCITTPLGLRWFEFDIDKGFFLNGEHLKLIGTNRHQCYEGLGNALRDEMHVRDIKLLKEMGGNFLRIAHYPQDPTIIEMCDKLGIITSVEIPLINYVTESQDFLNVSETMVTEMVYQQFNSPSIVMWAYMNEIMLRPPYNSDKSIDKEQYDKFVLKVAQTLEDKVKSIDPDRYTMMACHSGPHTYKNIGLGDVPDILGWNIYKGWYGSTFSDLDNTLDLIRELFPDKFLLITEYGAGVDPRLHSFESQRFDFTAEYGVKYHRYYLRTILENDYIAGSNIWNLNDFHSEVRGDAVPYINSKGVTGLNRERKDTYYLYKAALLKTPIIHICNDTWKSRAAAGDGGVTSQEVMIFTNADQISLSVNGVDVGQRQVTDYCAIFESVEFTNGENQIIASGSFDSKEVIEVSKIDYDIVPQNLKDPKHPFSEMNINLGSKQYFEDRDAEMCWIPEQEYQQGSWGYIGGEPFRIETRYGDLPNSNLSVLGTPNDPIFQSQREGLEAFKADVPDGRYSVYLYLCELKSGKDREVLAYNLGNDAISERYSPREFNVSINGVAQISNLNIADEFGSERGVIKKFVVDVTDGKGLNIEFEKVVEQPILNAIRIYKNY